MLLGMTQVIFEGIPTYPDASRAWAISDKYKVPRLSLLHKVQKQHATLLYNASMQLAVPKFNNNHWDICRMWCLQWQLCAETLPPVCGSIT